MFILLFVLLYFNVILLIEGFENYCKRFMVTTNISPNTSCQLSSKHGAGVVMLLASFATTGPYCAFTESTVSLNVSSSVKTDKAMSKLGHATRK